MPDGTEALSVAGLKRRLMADLAEARLALDPTNPAREAAVHLARRRLKRARTLSRVLVRAHGDDQAPRSGAIRDAFRLLSTARDADAMLAAARWLASRADDVTSPAAATLVQQLERRAAELRSADIPYDQIYGLLSQAEVEAAALAESGSADDLLRNGLVAVYRRGRRLFGRARDERDDDAEALHEWRKQVKHRLHLGQITEGTDLAMGTGILRDLDRLAEYLGEEHDFANLTLFIASDAHPIIPPADLARLTTLINRRREKLTERALSLGADLYGERVKRFVARLG